MHFISQLKLLTRNNYVRKTDSVTNHFHFGTILSHKGYAACIQFGTSIIATAYTCTCINNLSLKTGSLHDAIREFSLALLSWVISQYYTILYKYGERRFWLSTY